MNKIYKVIYSKVKQCYIVVSELAKSHVKSAHGSNGQQKAALTAAVLLALGAFSFVGMPVVQADGTESLRNNDFVGANDQYWYYDENDKEWKTYQYKLTSAFNNRARGKLPNYQGGGAKSPGAITAGLYAQAGQQTVTIGDRNAGASRGSVFIGEHSGYDDGASNTAKGESNNYVTSVGFQSDATGWGSIAIGSNAIAENSNMTSDSVTEVGNYNTTGTVRDDTYSIEAKPAIEGASVALGYNAHSKDGNIAIGANSEATSTDSAGSYLSVGNKNLKRRITNVAQGTDNSDVVTVGQMNDAIKQADNLNVNAGWGINVADEKDTTGKVTKNVISLKHNLGTGYNDAEANGMIIGGLVEDRDSAKQYGAADANSVVVGAGKALASGKSSVVVGGLDNVASGATSVVVGGDNNNAAGNQSAVFGGRNNTAGGIASTAGGGIMNVANGQQAVALGGAYNYALGTSSTAIGGTGGNGMYGYSTSVNGNYSVSLAGGSTGTDALNGLAAGNRSVVTTANGTAVGYQATTDQEGTIAFGHDAGDVSGYAVTWKQRTDGKTNADHTTNDYTQVPDSVTPTTYQDAYYNRLVKVADGQDDHDVVVMEQLKQYAEKDASNLGNNIKVYKTDGKGNVQLDKDKNPVEDTGATTTAQKNSKDDWGKALGAGTLTAATAKESDQLVTGKTLYNYDKPTGSTNYVNANNTTGQNLSALDAQVKSNADTLNDKTHNIKYYSVSDNAPTLGFDSYSNAGNDGAKGKGSLAAGFVTHADGIASTVVGSYSGVMNKGTALGPWGLDYRGATAVSLGTVNVNNNTDTSKTYSGVANSIVGQANMTTNSNAAIIYGAGNTVTNSYRPIAEDKASAIFKNVSDPTKLGKAMQDAVKESGGQVMVMGGGNNVESAYMSQVVGVGNTVKGNQVKNDKGEWATDTSTDTSNTAIQDYDPEKSSQYNYVDGFNNEVINGKHDYIIGANNKLDGDSYDDNNAKPIKRSNKSNVVIGDNHVLTGKKNNVIIGSADTEGTLTRASDAVIIGHKANATSDTGADNAVAIGLSATAGGGNAVTIGVNTSAGDNSITIGSESHAISGSNIAIGRSAQVYGYEVTNAVALGQEANAQVADGVAIGSGSEATVAGKTTEGYDPATGQNSTETTATWQATKAAVSIGKADGTVTRQINGVAAGTNDTDAVNVAQLKSLQSGLTSNLTNTGLKFAANSGNEYTAKLGTTVKVLGTAKKEGHEYTADNLTTEIDEKGNITILMDKNVSAEKIAVNGKDGEKGKPGTAGSIGISGQDGKAGVGIDGKDGISIKGQNGKDGVTIKGIDGVDGVDGAEGHIGLNGKDGMTDIFTTAGTPGLDGKDGETMTRIVYKDPKGTEHEAATLDDGLKFKGDDGKEIAKKLNNTLDIIGGAKGDLTEGNIGVNNDSGKLKVQLAKDLKGITSISNQKTTKVGGKDVTTGAKVTLGADGSVDVNGGKITHVGSGADASGNYTTTTNAANIGDVQKIVKDAVDSAADTTNKALAGKANVDASNIGANLKGEDGKTPATEAEKTKNENAWGSAIGTGKIEANNGQLVTGKTVYEYNKPVAEDGKTLNYVSEGKTTGQNLGALDAQVKNNADAIKKNSESIQNITNNVKNLSDNAVQYDKDSNKTKVTLGGDGGTTITNVKDGALSDSSSDAVNGKQLYNEQKAREAADKDITEKVTNNTNEITKIKNGDFTDASKTAIHNIAKDAVKVVDGKNTKVTTVDGTDTTPTTYAVNVEGTGKVASGDTGLISGGTLYNEVHVTTDGSYIKGSQTVGQNLSALDSGLKTTSDLIHTNTKGDTIQIGGNSTATKIDVSGEDAKGNKTGRVITGVVSDASDPNSAANVGYVNGITSASNEQIYRDMNMQYNHVENDISRAAAGSNALAALHPMQEFDPDDKAQYALGYGHYRNSNAGAVGVFYQPDENSLFSLGASFGNGDAGINAGVTFKFGPGGSGHHALTKTQMAKVIDAQSKEIDALKKDNADKDKRIDALEQKVNEILAKVEKDKA